MKKLFIFVLVLVPTCSAFAYDNHTTHPGLTAQIVDFYNSKSADKLTDQEKQWIIEGSILEDAPPRWVNHFYDPTTQLGWMGDKTQVSQTLLAAITPGVVAPDSPVSAVDWVNDRSVQVEYGRYGGIHTWNQGLSYYADGDKKDAYITLGYTLHLLEDMGVPEHTRNDTHINDSPYESYAARWNLDTLDLDLSKSTIPAQANVQNYMIAVAKYSNQHFFSKDTIQNYALPKIAKKDDQYGYGKDENGKLFPLVRTYSERKNDGSFEEKFTLDTNQNNQIIFDNYFARLARQIVLNGAGVVDLFQKQGKEAVVLKEYPSRLVKLNPDYEISGFSLLGELYKAEDAALGFVNGLLGKNNKTGDAAVLASINTSGPKPSSDEIALVSNIDRNLDGVPAAPLAAGHMEIIAPSKTVSASLNVSAPPQIDKAFSGPQNPAPHLTFVNRSVENQAPDSVSNSNTTSSDSDMPGEGADSTSTEATSTESSSTEITGPLEMVATSSVGSISVSWNISDVEHSYVYEIYDRDPGKDEHLIKTASSSGSYDFKVDDIGTEHTVSVRAVRDDGTVFVKDISVYVPSFVSKGYFYEKTPGSGTYVLDLYKSMAPGSDVFWYHAGWDAVVSYLTASLNGYSSTTPTGDGIREIGSNLVTFTYPTCAGPVRTDTVLYLSTDNSNDNLYCGPWGAWQGVGMLDTLTVGENGVLNKVVRVQIDVPPGTVFKPNDYVTLNFYFAGKGFLGSDKTKYYFLQSAPHNLPPPSPKIKSVDYYYNSYSGSFLTVVWDPSDDEDTPQGLLGYEVVMSGSPQNNFEGNLCWGRPVDFFQKPVLSVWCPTYDFSNPHYIAIRAVDDFGNYSEPSYAVWTPEPEGDSINPTSVSSPVSDPASLSDSVSSASTIETVANSTDTAPGANSASAPTENSTDEPTSTSI